VVDALGGSARRRQMASFCQQQLQPYKRTFLPGSEAAQLDAVERRFAWFRRLLRELDGRFAEVFPLHWRLEHRLTILFLEQTRALLSTQLEGGDDPDKGNVTVLLKALQKSLVFEKEMKAKFEADLPEALRAKAAGLDAEAAAGESDDPYVKRALLLLLLLLLLVAVLRRLQLLCSSCYHQHYRYCDRDHSTPN
jgi:hypothetical protein